MIFLPKCVAKLSDLASNDATRYALSCVRIEPPLGDESWRLIATDGKRLGIVQGLPDMANEKTTSSKHTLENIIGIDGAIIPGPAMMDVDDWKRMWALKDRVSSSVAILATEKQVAYALGTQSNCAMTVGGRYPDYMQALPRRAPLLQVRFVASLLADICRVAAAIAGDVNAPVIISFYGNGQPLTVMSRNEQNGVTFDGLLMPLS